MASSAIKGAAAQLGGALFRFRSFIPVPIIAITVGLLWRSRGIDGPGGAMVDAALNAGGVGVALLGQAIRFYTLGLVREGTSGQGPVMQATQLNTRGPYAHVRNPLYVGNLGLCLGLLLIAHDPAAYGLVLGFFFVEYFFIIRAEEDFLLRTHGEPYREFLARVPRWVPRLTPAYEGPLNATFDLGRALKKEHNPFAAWGTGAILLWGWELSARDRLTPGMLALLVAVEAVVLVSFAVIKAYKRGWLFRV